MPARADRPPVAERWALGGVAIESSGAAVGWTIPAPGAGYGEPVPYADRRVTPLWLSHHYPEDYGRCVRIGRSHVCRRCLALYPVTLVALIAGLAVGPEVTNDAIAAVVVMIVLPVPAVVEFVLEHLGLVGYHPGRQIAVTVVMAVALGLAFARYLRHPGDVVFWAAIAVYGSVCLASALSGRREPSGVGGR